MDCRLFKNWILESLRWMNLMIKQGRQVFIKNTGKKAKMNFHENKKLKGTNLWLAQKVHLCQELNQGIKWNNFNKPRSNGMSQIMKHKRKDNISAVRRTWLLVRELKYHQKKNPKNKTVSTDLSVTPCPFQNSKRGWGQDTAWASC